jgi:hypothetical protein
MRFSRTPELFLVCNKHTFAVDIWLNFNYLASSKFGAIQFVVLGETDTKVFSRNFFGYLGGLTFLFIGFIKWFPLISNMKKVDAELCVAAVAFESREGILITDAKNIILRANQTFCKYLVNLGVLTEKHEY